MKHLSVYSWFQTTPGCQTTPTRLLKSRPELLVLADINTGTGTVAGREAGRAKSLCNALFPGTEVQLFSSTTKSCLIGLSKERRCASLSQSCNYMFPCPRMETQEQNCCQTLAVPNNNSTLAFPLSAFHHKVYTSQHSIGWGGGGFVKPMGSKGGEGQTSGNHHTSSRNSLLHHNTTVAVTNCTFGQN